LRASHGRHQRPGVIARLQEPGPAERALLRRVSEELGAGRIPNVHIAPEHAALALAHAATGARALDGKVARESVSPQVGLTTDFGAVAEGHPIEAAVAVPRRFFTDARSFRHLPDLLAQLDRYDELTDLIRPGFVLQLPARGARLAVSSVLRLGTSPAVSVRTSGPVQ
jgi:hypothetical protein